jgi:hypothetical protein
MPLRIGFIDLNRRTFIQRHIAEVDYMVGSEGEDQEDGKQNLEFISGR